MSSDFLIHYLKMQAKCDEKMPLPHFFFSHILNMLCTWIQAICSISIANFFFYPSIVDQAFLIIQEFICHAFVSPTKYRPVCISCSNIICKSILFFICPFGFSIKILIISFISLKSFTKPGIWFLWQHNIDLRSSSISPLQRNLRKN